MRIQHHDRGTILQPVSYQPPKPEKQSQRHDSEQTVPSAPSPPLWPAGLASPESTWSSTLYHRNLDYSAPRDVDAVRAVTIEHQDHQSFVASPQHTFSEVDTTTEVLALESPMLEPIDDDRHAFRTTQDATTQVLALENPVPDPTEDDRQAFRTTQDTVVPMRRSTRRRTSAKEGSWLQQHREAAEQRSREAKECEEAEKQRAEEERVRTAALEAIKPILESRFGYNSKFIIPAGPGAKAPQTDTATTTNAPEVKIDPAQALALAAARHAAPVRPINEGRARLPFVHETIPDGQTSSSWSPQSYSHRSRGSDDSCESAPSSARSSFGPTVRNRAHLLWNRFTVSLSSKARKQDASTTGKPKEDASIAKERTRGPTQSGPPRLQHGKLFPQELLATLRRSEEREGATTRCAGHVTDQSAQNGQEGFYLLTDAVNRSQRAGHQAPIPPQPAPEAASQPEPSLKSPQRHTRLGKHVSHTSSGLSFRCKGEDGAPAAQQTGCPSVTSLNRDVDSAGHASCVERRDFAQIKLRDSLDGSTNDTLSPEEGHQHDQDAADTEHDEGGDRSQAPPEPDLPAEHIASQASSVYTVEPGTGANGGLGSSESRYSEFGNPRQMSEPATPPHMSVDAAGDAEPAAAECDLDSDGSDRDSRYDNELGIIDCYKRGC